MNKLLICLKTFRSPAPLTGKVQAQFFIPKGEELAWSWLSFQPGFPSSALTNPSLQPHRIFLLFPHFRLHSYKFLRLFICCLFCSVPFSYRSSWITPIAYSYINTKLKREVFHDPLHSKSWASFCKYFSMLLCTVYLYLIYLYVCKYTCIYISV